MASHDVQVAVQAYRSAAETRVRWQPLMDYLGSSIPGYRFVLSTPTVAELDTAAAAGQVDFVLTNPSQYVLMSYRDGLSAPLAMLVNQINGQPVPAIGGVIIALAQRTDILQGSDLRGRRIAMPGMGYLAGYQAQAQELRRFGVDVARESKLLALGASQENVVAAVLKGEADAGFVRTGLIEEMAREGRLQPGQLRVLNAQKISDFPLAVSTRLYPEWAFAAMPQVDEALVRRVVITLLGIEHAGQQAGRLGIHGFEVPADYRSVETLMRELRVPPFDQTPEFTLADILRRFPVPVLAGLASLLLVAVLIVWALRANRRLTHQRATLQADALALQHLHDDGLRPQLLLEDETITSCSQAVLLLLGRTREQVIGQTITSISPNLQPDGQRSGDKIAALRSMLRDGRSRQFEWTHQRADGSLFKVDVAVSPFVIQNKPRLHCSWIDIGAQEALAAQLQARTQLLSALIDALPYPVFYQDGVGHLQDCNRAFEAFFGVSRSALIGKSAWDLLPQQAEVMGTQDDPAPGTPTAGRVRRVSLRSVHGSEHEMVLHTTTLRANEGQISGLVGALTDSTELQRTQQALQAARERLDAILDNSPALIYVITVQTLKPSYVSPRLLVMLGIDNAAVIGQADWWRNSLHPDDRWRATGAFKAWLAAGSPDTLQQRYRLRKASGEFLEVDDRVQVLRTPQGESLELVGLMIEV